MKVILVNIGVFQEYIFETILQLKKWGNNDIVIISPRAFFDRYAKLVNYDGVALVDGIELVATEDLHDFNYNATSGMCRVMRGGFPFYTSQRLFFVYSYMVSIEAASIKKQIQLNQGEARGGLSGGHSPPTPTPCVHIENDNMVYANLDNVFFDTTNINRLCAVFDSPKRVIAGIIFIPSAEALGAIMEQYRPNLNDMENLGLRHDAIEKLPLVPYLPDEVDPNYTVGLPYAENYGAKFGNYIFDAAAMGQYLGGIDPRNTSIVDSRGFVNETCVVKFDNYDFFWQVQKKTLLKKPYLKIGETLYSIANLHIHSKNLRGFRS